MEAEPRDGGEDGTEEHSSYREGAHEADTAESNQEEVDDDEAEGEEEADTRDEENQAAVGAPVPQEDGADNSGSAAAEGWVYIDDGGEERGPYTLQEMLTWWNGQLLRPDLQVRRESESDYTVLSARPEFNPYYYAYYYQYYYGSSADEQQQQHQAGAAATAGGGSTTTTATAGAAPGPDAASQVGYGGGDASYASPATTAPQPADPNKELAARLIAAGSYTQIGSFNARTGR